MGWLRQIWKFLCGLWGGLWSTESYSCGYVQSNGKTQMRKVNGKIIFLQVNGKDVDPESPEGKKAIHRLERTRKEMHEDLQRASNDLQRTNARIRQALDERFKNG